MNESSSLPKYDDSGINLADPNDNLGLKTEYISLLQSEALRRYVGSGSGIALDVGCGYGRMSKSLKALGYEVVGVEPSLRVLRAASELSRDEMWCTGSLPDLPFAHESFELVCLFNVARSLHLLGQEGVCASLPYFVKRGGRLVVLDNLRKGHPNYLTDKWFIDTFQRQGITLKSRVAIRASRWPVIFLIRYGIVPERLFTRIAHWELNRMRKKSKAPSFSYFNFLYIFEKE